MVNEKAVNERLHYIRCEARGVMYALEMGRVRSVERAARLELEAGARGLVGWLPTAVERIPIYSLAERLGHGAEPITGMQRVVVLHDPVRSWGLLVDQVMQVATMGWGQVVPLPLSMKNGRSRFFQGVIRHEEQTVLLLLPEELHPDAAPPAPAAEAAAPRVRRQLDELDLSRPRHLVIFSLPGFATNGRPISFGLSSKQVVEVLDVPPLLPLLHQSPYTVGLVQWRKQTVPVVRLTKEEVVENGRLRLMIIRVPETKELVGLLAKSDMRMVELPVAHRPSERELPLPPLFVAGCVELARETLVVPNMEAVLALRQNR